MLTDYQKLYYEKNERDYCEVTRCKHCGNASSITR